MDSKLTLHDSTSDESSSYVIINDIEYGTKMKKSHSLHSFRKNSSFTCDSSASSSTETKSNAHTSSSPLLKRKSRHKKESQRTFNSTTVYKYLKITFTLTVIALILIQTVYNFFIYKNKISINSISELGVESVFKSEETQVFMIDREHYFNRSLLFILNKTQLTPQELEEKQIKDENNQVFFDEFKLVVTTIDRVYNESSIPLRYCAKVPEKLEGYLDSNAILQQANLSSLVQFYDAKSKNKTIQANKEKIEKSKNKHIVYHDLFYLNGTDFVRNDTSENWLLWNSNNMSGLLNMSKSFFGRDGERVELGGHWKPKDCISNFKVAIIIPYRDRLPHLKVLLYYLHMVLQRQLLDYRIFVVEPTSPPEVRFNKGRVMNAAFLEALKIDPNIDCFIFHDVDLIPEDDRTMYTCPPKPRHLSAAIDKFDYILPYNYLVGGVFAIRTNHYKEINGYSNIYWGWGAEDDDLSVRIRSHKLDIIRHPAKLARYKMIRHKQQKLNPHAHENLKKANSRHRKDGVNTIKYTVVRKSLYTGFTHFLLDIGTLESKKE